MKDISLQTLTRYAEIYMNRVPAQENMLCEKSRRSFLINFLKFVSQAQTASETEVSLKELEKILGKGVKK